ncbi:MAG: hypothetical protein ABWY78_15045 [Microvirga sp.]
MGAQTSFGAARHLHLARAARVAGEAFAFNEPEAAPTKRLIPMGLVTVAFGMVVAAILMSLL